MKDELVTISILIINNILEKGYCFFSDVQDYCIETTKRDFKNLIKKLIKYKYIEKIDKNKYKVIKKFDIRKFETEFLFRDKNFHDYVLKLRKFYKILKELDKVNQIQHYKHFKNKMGCSYIKMQTFFKKLLRNGIIVKDHTYNIKRKRLKDEIYHIYKLHKNSDEMFEELIRSRI